METKGEIWGKWWGANEGTPYPLLAHLLDTAAQMNAIWELWLPVSTKSLLTEILGGESTAKSVSLFIAGIHDLGKAEPYFQGPYDTRNRQPQNKFISNLEGLLEQGYPEINKELARKLNSMTGNDRRHIRHEAVSAEVLSSFGYPQWLSTIISAHHGKYLHSITRSEESKVERHKASFEGNQWRVAQTELIKTLSEVTKCPLSTISSIEVEANLIPLLSGLLIFSDWLASDEAFITSSPIRTSGINVSENPQEYFEIREKESLKRLHETLGVPPQLTGDFEKLFDGKSPNREIQKWAVGAGHGSGLTIITAPMGEGKTEAGLWIHKAGNNNDGLIYALPTTAMADAMFDRVRNCFKDTSALGALSHGTSILNSFYDDSTANPIGICDEVSKEEEDATGLQASQLFRGAHRSLTAPITVTTCDQVLAAGIKHKFSPVRFASLAGKHIILDEVHTYDPYQDFLFCRVLGWLGLYRVRVTILTATLPERRLKSYIDAYSGQKVLFDTPEYPSITRLSNGLDNPETISLQAYRKYNHFLYNNLMIIDEEKREDFQESFAIETAEYVERIREENPTARIVVFVNTVNRAIAVSKLLESNRNILTIHSRMTANQRNRKMKELVRQAGVDGTSEPITIVTTQIGESSLDFDADIAISDLAPMASLLQRMGRQWRHSEPTDTAWKHKQTVEVRRNDIPGPTFHILIPLDSDKNLHSKAFLPYTPAEIHKTWTQGLSSGERENIRIPGDIQGLVNKCDISLADLSAEDSEFNKQTEDYLVKVMEAKNLAKNRGVSVKNVKEYFPDDAQWNNLERLPSLTEGSIWGSEETQTRLALPTLKILIYSEEAGSDYNYSKDPFSILQPNHKVNREELRQIIGSTLPVNGKIMNEIYANFIQGKEKDARLEKWTEEAPILLKSIIPISTKQLNSIGLYLDDDLGLTKI